MPKELDKLTFDLFAAKRLKTEHNAEIKILNAKIEVIETKLLAEMGDQDLVKSKFGTVYISKQIVPKVVNWDVFYEHIRKNNSFELLERRPSKAAFREQYEQGEAIPGLDPVIFNEIRTRKS